MIAIVRMAEPSLVAPSDKRDGEGFGGARSTARGGTARPAKGRACRPCRRVPAPAVWRSFACRQTLVPRVAPLACPWGASHTRHIGEGGLRTLTLWDNRPAARSKKHRRPATKGPRGVGKGDKIGRGDWQLVRDKQRIGRLSRTHHQSAPSSRPSPPQYRTARA